MPRAADTLPPMRVFLGVTGASGAPYAERLLRALVEAGCEVGVCASGSGIEVLATELYRDASLPRGEVLSRFVGDAAPDEGLTSSYPDIPAEHALRGFNHVRALAAEEDLARELVTALSGLPPRQ